MLRWTSKSIMVSVITASVLSAVSLGLAIGVTVAWHRGYAVLPPCVCPSCAKSRPEVELGRLRQMTATIAGLCHLDLFSTEIALTADHLFIVIDYVNDQIDLRLQSKALEGVPDYIVGDVAAGLVELMARSCPSLPGV